MEALFIVPTLVSNQVNEKLIPALAKMIERNVLLNNGSLFKRAGILKYQNRDRFDPRRLLFREDGKNYISSVETINDLPVYFMNESVINESLSTFDKCSFILQEEGPTREQQKEYARLQMALAATNDPIEQNMYRKQLKQLDDLYKNQSSGTSISNKKSNSLDDEKTRSDIAKNMATYGKSKYEVEKLKKDLQHMDKFSQIELKKELAAIDKLMVDIDRNKKLAPIEIAQAKEELLNMRSRVVNRYAAKSGEGEYRYDQKFTSLDAVQVPKDVTFFNQISLEPTFMEIPISIPNYRDPKDGSTIYVVKVGVKCVPYIIDGVTSIKWLLNEAKNMGKVEGLFKKAFRKVNIMTWFTHARKIFKGEEFNPDEAVLSLKYSPNVKELNRSSKLARLFKSNDSSPWSTMIILSSFDFKDDSELADVIKNYKKLNDYVFGDIIITNETKESAYFCTPRYGMCQELSFSYLRKVLNLENIIDYGSITKQHNPWKMEVRPTNAPFSKSIAENVKVKKDKKELIIEKIDQILNK